MSSVTETAQQCETNLVNNISQHLKNYAFETVQENLKNITLVALYQLYQKLPKVEKKQLLNNLPLTQKIDLTLLSNGLQPVIELVKAQSFVMANINDSVASIKAKLHNKSNFPIIVTDKFNQYVGIVELLSLYKAPNNSPISELITSVTKLHASETQQNAAHIIANNNDHFAVLVDKQNCLVGLLNLTDIVKTKASLEANNENRPYLQIPVLSHVRQRIFWILALAGVGLLSGMIIQSYDDAITALIILAFYMPMVADTGGNAGSQAATVIIRSIATGELRLKNWFAVLYKEFRIAIFIGLGLACVSFLKIHFLSYGIELPEGLTLKMISLAIALALFIQVLSATVIGAGLPLVVKFFKQDPAVVASPAITTIVDVTGLLIYFYITSTLLLY